MKPYSFVSGETYTKNDIYRICRVPLEKQKGNWNTGYTNYDGDWFIFCNVGVAGRTGHDYENRFVGDDLHWFGKNNSTVRQDSVRSLVSPSSHIHIFYREQDRDPFTFAGLAFARSYKNSSPVQVTWGFKGGTEQRSEVLPQEVVEPAKYIEGSTKKISVNIYERNPQARRVCIEEHGCMCAVCSFDFELEFGDIGKDFIHVHHLKQLAEIGHEYELDPIKELRPVCPNCHAMLHRNWPAYSIEELRNIRSEAKKKIASRDHRNASSA